jgi:hypothetical protein
MDWQSLLAEHVRSLEAKANGHDLQLAEEARQLLRIIRAYEQRVRQLTLRADYRLARTL